MDANPALPLNHHRNSNLDLQWENIQYYFAKTLPGSSLAAPLEMGHLKHDKESGNYKKPMG